MGEEIKTADFALKAQKKILGKMASKNLTKLLIDEKTADILDEFYRIRKLQTGNKKEAEKLLKDVIKVVIKLGVLQMNDKFSCEEIKIADNFHKKSKMTAMTIISFCEVDFTFDKFVLSKQINEGRTILQQLIAAHLTDKSKNRINSVFDILGDADFLEELFQPDSKYKASLVKITERLNQLLDDGVL